MITQTPISAMKYDMIFKYHHGTVKFEGVRVNFPNLAEDQELILALCEMFGPLKSIMINLKYEKGAAGK